MQSHEPQTWENLTEEFKIFKLYDPNNDANKTFFRKHAMEKQGEDVDMDGNNKYTLYSLTSEGRKLVRNVSKPSHYRVQITTKSDTKREELEKKFHTRSGTRFNPYTDKYTLQGLVTPDVLDELVTKDMDGYSLQKMSNMNTQKFKPKRGYKSKKY